MHPTITLRIPLHRAHTFSWRTWPNPDKERNRNISGTSLFLQLIMMVTSASEPALSKNHCHISTIHGFSRVCNRKGKSFGPLLETKPTARSSGEKTRAAREYAVSELQLSFEICASAVLGLKSQDARLEQCQCVVDVMAAQNNWRTRAFICRVPFCLRLRRACFTWRDLARRRCGKCAVGPLPSAIIQSAHVVNLPAEFHILKPRFYAVQNRSM